LFFTESDTGLQAHPCPGQVCVERRALLETAGIKSWIIQGTSAAIPKMRDPKVVVLYVCRSRDYCVASDSEHSSPVDTCLGLGSAGFPVI